MRNSIHRAVGLSLLIHLLFFGSAELAHRLGWLSQSLWTSIWPSRPLDPKTLTAVSVPTPQEPPLLFIEVDPEREAPKPPENAQFYSSRDSEAGNPETELDTDVPKIDGAQDKVPKTSDSPRPTPLPLEPAPAEITKAEPEPAPPEPPAPPVPELAQESLPPAPRAPEGGERLGDLALGKPSDTPPREQAAPERPRPAKQNRPRPRTLAAARQQRAAMAGQKMMQEGGVRRFSLEPSVNAKATPFGAYDAVIIAAIQQRWYDLLEERPFALNLSGKVVLTFRLNSDGRITEMRVSENEVSEVLAIICQNAVRDPSPFPPWPSDLRRLVGADYREVRFTFHHN